MQMPRFVSVHGSQGPKVMLKCQQDDMQLMKPVHHPHVLASSWMMPQCSSQPNSCCPHLHFPPAINGFASCNISKDAPLARWSPLHCLPSCEAADLSRGMQEARRHWDGPCMCCSVHYILKACLMSLGLLVGGQLTCMSAGKKQKLARLLARTYTHAYMPYAQAQVCIFGHHRCRSLPLPRRAARAWPGSISPDTLAVWSGPFPVHVFRPNPDLPLWPRARAAGRCNSAFWQSLQ